MSSNQTQNITAGFQNQGLLGWVLFSMVTTLPCCACLFINGVMLFTLKSKAVFRDSSRYTLLFNLLFADTVQLAESQLMFLMSTAQLFLLHSLCSLLIALNIMLHVISPLVLILMCLERYIAVCFPLRHAAVVTIRNTQVAVSAVWTISSVNFLTQLLLMLKVPFSDSVNKKMTDFCGKNHLAVDPVFILYDKVFTYFLFTLAGLSVTFSYFGIIVAAKSASTDKASAKKARRTLLLHLVQLGLTMSATVHGSLLSLLSSNLNRVLGVTVQIVLYICLIVAPKCLSSLIYGLRDQTIRPVLLFHLSCHRAAPRHK